MAATPLNSKRLPRNLAAKNIRARTGGLRRKKMCWAESLSEVSDENACSHGIEAGNCREPCPDWRRGARGHYVRRGARAGGARGRDARRQGYLCRDASVHGG